MVLKKERTAETQEKGKERQEQQEEITTEKDETANAAMAAEEVFDHESAKRSDLLAKIRELEDRLKEAEERVLRTAADAENFKKRLQREKEEQIRYANETLMRELLPVIDNLERALEHSQTAANQEGLHEGLNMTLKVFMDTLSKFGCTALDTIGKTFDPNFHEAVSQEKSSQVEPSTVVKELQKGYMLKERLLRPAMVIVSMQAQEGEGGRGGQETTETVNARNGEIRIPVRKA